MHVIHAKCRFRSDKHTTLFLPESTHLFILARNPYGPLSLAVLSRFLQYKVQMQSSALLLALDESPDATLRRYARPRFNTARSDPFTNSISSCNMVFSSSPSLFSFPILDVGSCDKNVKDAACEGQYSYSVVRGTCRTHCKIIHMWPTRFQL